MSVLTKGGASAGFAVRPLQIHFMVNGGFYFHFRGNLRVPGAGVPLEAFLTRAEAAGRVSARRRKGGQGSRSQSQPGLAAAGRPAFAGCSLATFGRC